MSEFKLLVIALLLYGTSTLANTNTSSNDLGSYVSKIDSNVQRLNTKVPDLHVKRRVDPMNIPAAVQILGDLQSLENALQGLEQVPPHSLTTLTCARALCFGDDSQ